MDLLGDDSAFAVFQRDTILNGIFYVKQQACIFTVIVVINQNAAALHSVHILFLNQIDHSIQQWLTRADQIRLGLPGNRAVFLIKADTFVAVQDWFSVSDCHITVPHGVGHRYNLIPASFPLANASAKLLERVKEERFNKMRLELVCLHTLHILANCIDHMDIHRVIRQCIFPDDIPEYLRIKRFIHHTIESCAHFRVIAITHGFNQQVAQGFIIKRDFAKYIKNFSAEGLPLFLKF